MKFLSNAISVICPVLYATGFWICEYFYYTDMVKWRELRDFLTGIVILLTVLLNFMPKSDFNKAGLSAFLVLCFGDIVDRFLFDITTFVGSDYFLIGTAILIFAYKLRNAKDTRRSIFDIHKDDSSCPNCS